MRAERKQAERSKSLKAGEEAFAASAVGAQLALSPVSAIPILNVTKQSLTVYPAMRDQTVVDYPVVLVHVPQNFAAAFRAGGRLFCI